VIMEFLEYKIITRFGVPKNITIDNAKAFSSIDLPIFCLNYGIIISPSSNYYPKGNDLVESSNKNLITIIKKIEDNDKKCWDSKIKHALWAYQITEKEATRKSPFELVYKLEVTLSIHLKIPVY
jgi:hypothetical protein